MLIDFGSARQAFSGKTLTSIVTPGYAPFEQYDSSVEQQGPWTDIYGLGATLYRAISGRPPIDSIDRSRSLIRSSVDPYVAAVKIGENHYSERFLNAIDHALQFKEENRPKSISDWRKEFDIKDEDLSAVKQHASYPLKNRKLIIGFTSMIVFIGLAISFLVYKNVSNEEEIQVENNNINKVYKLENKLDGIWTSSYGPLIFQVLSDGSYTGTYSFSPYENGYIYGELNGTIFTGKFTEDVIGDEPYKKCGEEYRDSYNWGTLEFKFNKDFTEFNGKWADCADSRNYTWKGEKN